MPTPDISVKLGPITLKNPVMPASGTWEWNPSGVKCFDPSLLGAVVAKTVTMRPRLGNPPPRIYEVRAGLLNAVGIPSEGVEEFIRGTLKTMQSIKTAHVVSISGESVEDFGALANALNPCQSEITALELNLSCPNLSSEGKLFATDESLLRDVVATVRNNTTLPIIAKLSPNVSDIARMAVIAQDAGADILALINTLQGMAIDTKSRRPILGNVRGGLSGPAIKPVAVRMVWEAHDAVHIPIIGVGGISTADDAVEFMLAGATAVAVGTATFRNPMSMIEIIQGITDYLSEHGFRSVHDIVGAAKRGTEV